MADAFTCCQHRQQQLPASTMLAMVAAAATTARDDAYDAQPALSNSSFSAAPLIGGPVQQLEVILELDAASGALVLASQSPQRRTTHLRCFVRSAGSVSVVDGWMTQDVMSFKGWVPLGLK